MRILLFAILFLTFAVVPLGFAAGRSNKLNKNIYEQDSVDQSFTGKVKLIRQIQDETEVFFEEGGKGTYTLPSTAKDYAVMKVKLQKSYKSQGPRVKVMVDNENRILSVEISEAPDKD